MLKIINRISLAVLCCNSRREFSNQLLAIASPGLPLLLFLNNFPANQPIGHNLGGIDRTGRPSACGFDDLANASIQRRRFLKIHQTPCIRLANLNIQRNHLGPGLQIVQIVRPLLHHLSAFGEVGRSVVGPSVGIANGMG